MRIYLNRFFHWKLPRRQERCQIIPILSIISSKFNMWTINFLPFYFAPFFARFIFANELRKLLFVEFPMIFLPIFPLFLEFFVFASLFRLLKGSVLYLLHFHWILFKFSVPLLCGYIRLEIAFSRPFFYTFLHIVLTNFCVSLSFSLPPSFSLLVFPSIPSFLFLTPS